MDLSKIIDFWYDVIPTVTACIVVIACIIYDRVRSKAE
jgi:hypothetical protein